MTSPPATIRSHHPVSMISFQYSHYMEDQAAPGRTSGRGEHIEATQFVTSERSQGDGDIMSQFFDFDACSSADVGSIQVGGQSYDSDIEMSDIVIPQNRPEASRRSVLQQASGVQNDELDHNPPFETVNLGIRVPRPSAVSYDMLSRGNWSFTGADGNLHSGRNDWMPPVIEKDPTLVRYKNAWPRDPEFLASGTTLLDRICRPSALELAYNNELLDSNTTPQPTQVLPTSIPARRWGQLDTAEKPSPFLSQQAKYEDPSRGLEDFQYRHQGTFGNSRPHVLPQAALVGPSNTGSPRMHQPDVAIGGLQNHQLFRAPSMNRIGDTANNGRANTPQPTHTAKRDRNSTASDSPSAADLLKHKTGPIKRKVAISRGLQRIMTQAALEKYANARNVPVPDFDEDDVTEYFKWYVDKPKHAFISFSTAVNVDMRLLGNIRITAAELIAFFPGFHLWPDGIFRLIQNGWVLAEIVAYQNYVRNHTEGYRAGTYRSSRAEADLRILKGSWNPRLGRNARPKFKTTCFTTKGWVPPSKIGKEDANLIDYFLVDLAEGVVNFPSGSGAGLLTRAIQMAHAQDLKRAKLSEIEEFVNHFSLRFPLRLPMARMGLYMGYNPDVVVKHELSAEIRAGTEMTKQAEAAAKAAKSPASLVNVE